MKLTSIKRKLLSSISDSIHLKCSNKPYNSITPNIYRKINIEIWNPNRESIQNMQIRILNNLQNEIN